MSDNREWAREHSGQIPPSNEMTEIREISKKLDDINIALMTIASLIVMMLPDGRVESSDAMREIVKAVNAVMKEKK